MPGDSKPRERAAQGKGKSTGKGTGKTLEFDVFDTVYKTSKVFVFPDVVAPKPKLFKKVTVGEHLDLHSSRRQKAAGQDAEKSADETSLVTESQQQTQEKEGSSAKTYRASSSVNAATGAIQESVQPESTIDLKSSKDAQKGEKQGKKTKIKVPKSYVLDEEKLKDENVKEQLRSEECESLVLQQIKAALEEVMGPDDPPVFILHNQNLAVKVGSKQRTKIEQDVLNLHSSLGVLLVEVKAVKSRMSFSRFDVGTEQLLRAKETVLKEMGDLLEEDAIVLTIALPELHPEDSSFIRQRAQEFASVKRGHNDTAATSSPADKAVQSGEEGQVKEPKFKGTALLGDHPEIYLLCGLTAEVFRKWVRWLRQQRPKSGHTFKGANEAERLDNFKRACIRRLSFSGLRPGQSVRDSADLHHRFLLTREQLRVRDCQADLLHISGPTGSGKTLLLAERARRWLREGRQVALAVGLPVHNLLLRHLARSLCGEKVDARISIHRGYYALLDWLDNVSTEDPVFVILDEASANLPEVYGRLLDHVGADRVHGLWSADTQPLPGEPKRKLLFLGGSTAQLSVCLRCPPHVMNLTNIVRLEKDPPLLPPPVPATRELGVEVKVISHSDHPHSQSWDTCSSCGGDTKAFFAGLGLPRNRSKSALQLSDVVVITTSSCGRSRVARWLCSLGLHAVAEEEWDGITPSLPSSDPLGSHHQALEEARSRVLKGTDVMGNPVIHVVGSENFTGLEKPIVLLWHEDREDVDRYDKARDIDSKHHRLFRQSHSWFVAATRCQGRLAVMAVTPSPLLSMLQSTSAPLGILMEIRRPLRHMSVRPEAQHRSRHSHTRASCVRGEREMLSPRSPTSSPSPGVPTSRTSASGRPPPKDLPSRPAKAPSAHSETMSSQLLSPSSALSGAVPFHTFPQSTAPFGTEPSQPFPSASAPSKATSSHSTISCSVPSDHFPSPPAAFGATPSQPFPSTSTASEATSSHSFTPFSAPSGVTSSYLFPSSLAELGITPSHSFPSFSVPFEATPSQTYRPSPVPYQAMPSQPLPPTSATVGAMPPFPHHSGIIPPNPLPPFPPHSGFMPPNPWPPFPPHSGAMPSYANRTLLAPPFAPPQATFPS